MQIKSLRIKSYRSWAIADTASEPAIARIKKLELYAELKSAGCTTALCLSTIGWSKATWYRWLKRCQQRGGNGLEAQSRRLKRVRGPQWTKQQEQQVLHLRKRYPLWGKRKLWKVLSRDQGLSLSISRVGRILARLVRLKQVRPAAFYYGRVKPKRRRQFQHHARRWQYGMRARQPGELVQIDPMSVGLPAGFGIKEFKAACPVTGYVALIAYSRATSRNAKDFLHHLIEQAPFNIRSIQVDGGSEFRDAFEQPCEALNLPLFVLPPKKPHWNRRVERANGTSRDEFYPLYEGPLTVTVINQELARYQWTYHHYRPQDSLDLMTPMAYHQQLTLAA